MDSDSFGTLWSINDNGDNEILDSTTLFVESTRNPHILRPQQRNLSEDEFDSIFDPKLFTNDNRNLKLEVLEGGRINGTYYFRNFQGSKPQPAGWGAFMDIGCTRYELREYAAADTWWETWTYLDPDNKGKNISIAHLDVTDPGNRWVAPLYPIMKLNTSIHPHLFTYNTTKKLSELPRREKGEICKCPALS